RAPPTLAAGSAARTPSGRRPPPPPRRRTRWRASWSCPGRGRGRAGSQLQRLGEADPGVVALAGELPGQHLLAPGHRPEARGDVRLVPPDLVRLDERAPDLVQRHRPARDEAHGEPLETREGVDHHARLARARDRADARTEVVAIEHHHERLVAVLEPRQRPPHEALGQLPRAEAGGVGEPSVHHDLRAVREQVAPLLVLVAAVRRLGLLRHAYPFTPPAVCWPVREFWNE